MIIDANMFWFPEEIFAEPRLMQQFLAEIPGRSGYTGYESVSEKDGQKQIVIEKPKGFQNLNYAQGDYILEKQLAAMDQAGIDKAVLKVPGCQEWLSLDTCRRFNDGMAEHVRQSGGRMVALAVTPPVGTPECIKELKRCKNELGMHGVQLSAHYGDHYLDDESFDPFFEKLNRMDLPVYIHHTPVPVQYGSLYEYNNLRRFYGRCVDQVTAIGRVLFSGFFDRYPNLKFIHSMLGGGIFAYMNMMQPHAPKGDENVNRFDPASESLRRHIQDNLFFEMSQAQTWGKDQLECAVAVLGADHILFGTSFPVRREWLEEGPGFIRGLEIGDEEKELMLYKNAERLYRM